MGSNGRRSLHYLRCVNWDDIRDDWPSATQASAGRVEQLRPVALHVPVEQQVQADAVPVEAQAGVEVEDHHHGMMNASGHSTRG